MALPNDRAIAYEGEGEGVPLIFIHQVGTDHRLWHHQHAYFHTRYRMISVDVLGHGLVPWPRGELSLEHAAQRVQHLIERLGPEPAFVIGLSAGAAVAILLALEAPALLRGLVLISPWSIIDAHVRSLGERLFRRAESEDMAAYMDLFQRYAFSVGTVGRHRTEVELLRTLALQQDPRAVAYTWAACLACNLSERLEEVTTPSLIITGLHDLLTPPYLARVVAERLHDATLEVWETGHFPFLEDPGRFNTRLEAFISRCLVR